MQPRSAGSLSVDVTSPTNDLDHGIENSARQRRKAELRYEYTYAEISSSIERSKRSGDHGNNVLNRSENDRGVLAKEPLLVS